MSDISQIKIAESIYDIKSKKAKVLENYYSTRPITANATFTELGGLKTFVATSSMTEGKPTQGDSHILHMSWDSNNLWDALLAVSAGNSPTGIQIRSKNNGTWQGWTTVLTSNNYTDYPSSYLKAEDNRNVLPNSTGIADKYGVKSFFVNSDNFAKDYTDKSYNYHGDLLVLDTYVNSTGGKINALLFDKTPKTNNIWHFTADNNSDSWGTGRRLAYSDEVLEAPGVKYEPIFNTFYKYTAEYTKEDATNGEWLVRIDLDSNWNNTMCELVVHPNYGNISGAIKISRNDEIACTQYNGNNALEYFGHWVNGDGIHIYLKLQKNSGTWNNETRGYVKVYASYPITITEISELPNNITLKSIGTKNSAGNNFISKSFLSNDGVTARRFLPNNGGLTYPGSASLGSPWMHWPAVYAEYLSSNSSDYGVNLLAIPNKSGTLATLEDIPSIPSTSNFVLKSGDTMLGALTISTGDFRSGTLGLNIGGAHIGSVNSTSDMVIANSNIRFTKNNVYDWNQWAGLGYDPTTKTIKLGIADNTNFLANSAQNSGNVLLPGIKELKLENTTSVPQSLKFHSTPSDGLDWTSEIVTDYWGEYYNTTTGWTHGMYFVSGRQNFDNFIFLKNDKTPLFKIDKTGGFVATGESTINNNKVLHTGAQTFTDAEKNLVKANIGLKYYLEDSTYETLISNQDNSDGFIIGRNPGELFLGGDFTNIELMDNGEDDPAINIQAFGGSVNFIADDIIWNNYSLAVKAKKQTRSSSTHTTSVLEATPPKIVNCNNPITSLVFSTILDNINEQIFYFTTADTGCTIEVPDNTKIVGDLAVEPATSYVVAILNGILVIKPVEIHTTE